MSLRTKTRLALCLWFSLLLLWSLPVAAEDGDDPLPSWRGPIKAQIMDYVQAVTTSGGPDFIPPEQRIAAFDQDGTLVVERPQSFDMAMALDWLSQHCPDFAGRGPEQAALCSVAARGNRQELRSHIDALLSLPFDGWELDTFRSYARRFFETQPNPFKKRPLSKLVYQPQVELIALLARHGFRVWICSGSAVVTIQSVSARHFGVPPERCLGTRYMVRVERNNGQLFFKRGGVQPGLVNLGQVKAENLKLATVHGPVLAFGNSRGDEWMLRFAKASAHRSLALALAHDDSREFVYGRPEFLELAKASGWTVVSMKQAWQKVFVQ